MVKENLKIGLIVFINMILLAATGYAQMDRSEKHILVSMRMIGHKILLNSGDSSSQILPIKKESDRYKIKFKSEFQFKPEELVATIDSIVEKTRIANSYVVEVERSKTGEVIYSYQIGDSTKADLIPCLTRMPSKDYYNIVITILDPVTPAFAKESPSGKKSGVFFIISMLIVTVLILVGLYLFFRKKMLKSKIDPNVVMIGNYQFDTINSELFIQDQRVSLSTKESDLLLLLYGAANATVEREVILKNIWGDEGDYIGRTLDVFISKLRKKLEVDTSLKIVNIRGVGYKLLMNAHQ